MKPVKFVRLERFGHLEPPALQGLFDDLNRTLFRGRLPRYRVVYGPPPGDPRGCSGYCDPKARTIYVEPSPPTSENLRRILLHEMCHVGSLGHGKQFQAKLRRLASAGEGWAEKEATDFAQEIASRQPLTARVARQIRDLAVDLPGRQWSEVEGMFAIEMGLSVAELRRAAPWAERLFDRDREGGYMTDPKHMVTKRPQKREPDGTHFYAVECTCGERWEQEEGPFKCPKDRGTAPKQGR